MANSTSDSTKIAVARIKATADIERAKIQAKAKIDSTDAIINQKSAKGHDDNFNANYRAKLLAENRLEIERIKAHAKLETENIRQNSRKNASDNTLNILIGVMIVISFMAYFAFPSIFR